jgi:hypothetical protein
MPRKIIIGFISLLILIGGVYFYHYFKQKPPLKILFIGNSYTSVNSLPALFADIAVHTGQTNPLIKSNTPGGYTFEQHLTDATTLSLINNGYAPRQNWDVIILQNQSEIPAYASINKVVYDASITSAVNLYKLIRQHNPHARVILYETWARSADAWGKGAVDRNIVGNNPEEMQSRLRQWYETAAQTMSHYDNAYITVAHIGEIWQTNYASRNPIKLHQNDDSHPNFAGSYLTAINLFSLTYNIPIQKITYSAGLPENLTNSLKQLSIYP